MRSALALSALLLLLPPRSLSENGPTTAGPATPKPTTGNKPNAALAHSEQTIVTTMTSTAASTIEKTKPSASTSAVVSKSPSTAPTNSPGATSSAPTQKNTAVSPTDKGGVVVAGPHTTTDRPKTQGVSQSALPPTTKSVQPDTTHSQPAGTGAQSSPSIPTRHLTTQGTGAPTAAPPPVRPSGTTPAPSAATPASSHQPTATATLKPPGSSSEEPQKITTASSSVGTTTSPSSALHGAPTMPTSLVATQGNQQYSSKVPAVTGPSSSVTRPSSSVTGPTSSVPGPSSSVTGPSSSIPGPSSSETLQPGGPSLGPVATSSVTGPGSFSTHLAPTTPQAPRMSCPTSTPRNDGVLPAAGGQIQCGRPENQTERMLILNFTKTSPCAKNFSDDKLVTLLCRAAKATFNPAQDQCRIRLAPIPESQVVAIKEVTIQTNLLPRDVYESLKDKWDELKEVGVSNMKLGDQGPPEETEDRFSMPLIITIVCMASFLLFVAALYGCCHQRLSQRKDQQRLTEELQTVENGYHDNPTLEVMETSSEMQEKKVVNLNGELGDSWIVPLDNLTKDDLDEEEDTHL